MVAVFSALLAGGINIRGNRGKVVSTSGVGATVVFVIVSHNTREGPSRELHKPPPRGGVAVFLDLK